MSAAFIPTRQRLHVRLCARIKAIRLRGRIASAESDTLHMERELINLRERIDGHKRFVRELRVELAYQERV